MTRTRPNERVDTQARVLESLAIDVTRAIEHIGRELSNLDPEASSAPSERRSKGAVADPAGNLATERYSFTSRREDIRDWIDGLEGYVRSGRYLVDEALKMRTAHTELSDATDYGVKCRHVTPPDDPKGVAVHCTNWASEHRLPLANGTAVNGWCDDHWASEACQVCGDHAHEGRRVEGVRSCQAAYRKWQRETLRETA